MSPTWRSGLKCGDPILVSSRWSRRTLRFLHAWNVMKMDLAKRLPERW